MSRTFRKTGPESALAMFEAEADGLREIQATRTIRVPEILGCGIQNGESFLELERFTFDRATADTETKLGEQLARLHRHTAERFGWFRDNTIGPTPQINGWSDDWVAFFRQKRLDYQLELAAANGYGGEVKVRGNRLSRELSGLFENYEPVASLLHGDLWGGNWGSVNGEPVLYDPAVYYGDRESDIAMTMLFGGFGRPFYEAYEKSWPMAPGHERRLRLYQLYHVLNHLNLFGRSYLNRAVRLIEDLT
ncbi:MAG: fructosamine kinase family protein [Gammaproteobacteria bacterium]|nr:fructosamine kinase family protein [Gammaproteobacteria bacterium]